MSEAAEWALVIGSLLLCVGVSTLALRWFNRKEREDRGRWNGNGRLEDERPYQQVYPRKPSKTTSISATASRPSRGSTHRDEAA